METGKRLLTQFLTSGQTRIQLESRGLMAESFRARRTVTAPAVCRGLTVNGCAHVRSRLSAQPPQLKRLVLTPLWHGPCTASGWSVCYASHARLENEAARRK